MPALADRAAAPALTLAEPPAGFAANPYPWFAALREHDPVHAPARGVLPTRCDDVAGVYRSAAIHASSTDSGTPAFLKS